MTIGQKIFLGFVSILFLLMLVVGISYIAFEKSGEGLMSYKDLSQDTNAVSEVQSTMLKIQMKVKDYIINVDEKIFKEYQKDLEKTKQSISKLAIEDEKKKELTEKLDQYDSQFNDLKKILVKKQKIVQEFITEKGETLQKSIFELGEMALTLNLMDSFHLIIKISRKFQKARLLMSSYLSKDDINIIFSLYEELDLLNKYLKELFKILVDPKLLQKTKEIESEIKFYRGKIDEIAQLMMSNNDIIKNKLSTTDIEINGLTNKTKLNILTQLEQLGPEVIAQMNQMKGVIILISLITFILGIFVSLLLSKNLSKVLIKMSHELDATSSRVDESATNLFWASEDLRKAAGNQSQYAEKSSQAMNDMSKMINMSNSYSQESKSISHDIKNKTEDGNRIIEDLSTSMQSIQLLNEQLMSISDIINNIKTKANMINDIVFKTQLLSFNASIEAARAGQYGKGFSVVAEEVGNLASTSGNAATEMENLLTQSQIRVAKIVENTKKTLSQGTTVTKDVVEIFHQIADKIIVIDEKITKVAAANDNQKQGVTDSCALMMKLVTAAKENNIISDQASNYSSDLNTISLKVKDDVNVLKKFILG